MTVPTPPNPPDEPSEAPTAEQPTAAEPSAPPSATPAPAGTAAPPPVGPAGPPPAHFGPPPSYAPYPFAPRVREPWVNPAKRGLLSAIAVVAALVLVGGGIAIGAAATGGGHGPHRSVQMRPYQGQPGLRMPLNGHHRQRPVAIPGRGRVNGPRPPTVPGNTPTPAPSSSHR